MKKNNKENTKKALRQAKIMGVNVLVTNMGEVLTGVKQKITHSFALGGRNVRFYIVTPNPELVLMAQDNKELKEALNSADFAVPDGIGLAQAFKYQSLWAPNNIILRVPITFFQGLIVGAATFFSKNWLTKDLPVLKGREIFLELIKLADQNNWKVFFLGGEGDEAKLAAEKLKRLYKKIKIESFAGPILDTHAVAVSEDNKRLEKDAVDRINKSGPQVLFVAMKNPKQEIWIHNNLSKLNIGGAMAVGGTFRYIAGLSKLPPDWLASLGLEWVWRLITEPYRFKRILNAFPIFPLKVFVYKISRK